MAVNLFIQNCTVVGGSVGLNQTGGGYGTAVTITNSIFVNQSTACVRAVAGDGAAILSTSYTCTSDASAATYGSTGNLTNQTALGVVNSLSDIRTKDTGPVVDTGNATVAYTTDAYDIAFANPTWDMGFMSVVAPDTSEPGTIGGVIVGLNLDLGI
jgi:hypothetical protein